MVSSGGSRQIEQVQRTHNRVQRLLDPSVNADTHRMKQHTRGQASSHAT